MSVGTSAYVLLNWCEYGDIGVVGVFATLEQALKAQEQTTNPVNCEIVESIYYM